eukprot:TRINITY_DN28740_c0_g1_i1.p2 TRINITY_DN28740_c0_g1~~TRINITY_DN28740_c0_g1_i1.p2  ORF type:complete len:103 (+),score=33.14 TRINITY_DN28740_c0_g1_i1:386-694(+)
MLLLEGCDLSVDQRDDLRAGELGLNVRPHVVQEFRCLYACALTCRDHGRSGQLGHPALWIQILGCEAELIHLGGGSAQRHHCLLYTSPSPRDRTRSRMPSSA